MSNMATDGVAMRRIRALLDTGSFVPIGSEITARNTDFNLQPQKTPGDGVVTGYGAIDGNLVYVYSQEPAVLKGTIGEMHARKITALYELAMKTGAPIIGLLDSAGMRLQEGTDALAAFGQIYFKQTLASGVIPQISAVYGSCGGGLAVSTALSDFTFLAAEHGKLFLNSPNSITGNEISKCDTSSATFQSEDTGNVDMIGSEAEIAAGIRQLVVLLPANNEDADASLTGSDDLNRLLPGLENGAADPALVLTQLADNGQFLELKKDYARDLVTGFIRLNNATVGALGNRRQSYDETGAVTAEFDGRLSVRGARKAAAFVRFCDAFAIPLLTLTDVTGFQATKRAEKELVREAARLGAAFAGATVPKVNVITGQAFGTAAEVMNSKALGADLVLAWPAARIGMMAAESAARVMFPEADPATLKAQAQAYEELQNDPHSAARRGWVDTIIPPAETRKYVIGALEMLFTKREERPAKKHDTI